MLIKRDCTAGRERKRSKQGFISLVFQAAVFSLSSAGSGWASEKEREREIVDEMWWWEHKLGQIRVLLVFCLLSQSGPTSRPRGSHLSEGSCLPQSTVSSPWTTMLCPSLSVTVQSAHNMRLSDHAHVASVHVRLGSSSASVCTETCSLPVSVW